VLKNNAVLLLISSHRPFSNCWVQIPRTWHCCDVPVCCPVPGM